MFLRLGGLKMHLLQQLINWLSIWTMKWEKKTFKLFPFSFFFFFFLQLLWDWSFTNFLKAWNMKTEAVIWYSYPFFFSTATFSGSVFKIGNFIYHEPHFHLNLSELLLICLNFSSFHHALEILGKYKPVIYKIIDLLLADPHCRVNIKKKSKT